MDPNKLSMQEGKAFLRQLGIPQRDVDRMTERWVVIASVEVLLRFPLKPGEDPSASCISEKNSQSNMTSQKLANQEKRKSMEYTMLKNNQDPKDKRQPQVPPSIQKREILRDKTIQEVIHSSKLDDAREKNGKHPTLKHMASNSSFPIESITGVLPLWVPDSPEKDPENLGSLKQEDLEARTLQDPHTPGSFLSTDWEVEPRPRQEDLQTTASSQLPRNPQINTSPCEEPIDFCGFVRQPTRPRRVPTVKRRSVPGPILTRQSLDKTPSRTPDAPAPECSVNLTKLLHPAGKSLCQDQAVCSRQQASRPGIFSCKPSTMVSALGRSETAPQTGFSQVFMSSKLSAVPATQKYIEMSKTIVQAERKRTCPDTFQAWQKARKQDEAPS